MKHNDPVEISPVPRSGTSSLAHRNRISTALLLQTACRNHHSLLLQNLVFRPRAIWGERESHFTETHFERGLGNRFHGPVGGRKRRNCSSSGSHCWERERFEIKERREVSRVFVGFRMSRLCPRCFVYLRVGHELSGDFIRVKWSFYWFGRLLTVVVIRGGQ